MLIGWSRRRGERWLAQRLTVSIDRRSIVDQPWACCPGGGAPGLGAALGWTNWFSNNRLCDKYKFTWKNLRLLDDLLTEIHKIPYGRIALDHLRAWSQIKSGIFQPLNLARQPLTRHKLRAAGRGPGRGALKPIRCSRRNDTAPWDMWAAPSEFCDGVPSRSAFLMSNSQPGRSTFTRPPENDPPNTTFLISF